MEEKKHSTAYKILVVVSIIVAIARIVTKVKF